MSSDDGGDSARDKCAGQALIYVVLEIYYWITKLQYRCFCGLSKRKYRLPIYLLRVDFVIAPFIKQQEQQLKLFKLLIVVYVV